eukprot:1422381-Rhodomonas_salina.3
MPRTSLSKVRPAMLLRPHHAPTPPLSCFVTSSSIVLCCTSTTLRQPHFKLASTRGLARASAPLTDPQPGENINPQPDLPSSRSADSHPRIIV